MCGRMTLARDDFDEIAEEIAAIVPGVAFAPEVRAQYRPRFNIAPTDPHLIVVGDAGAAAPRVEAAAWGLRAGPKRPPLINARSETVASQRAFRDAFARRRCVVPADGFYEWGGPPEARQPYWLHRPDGRLLLFAGIFDEAPARRFSILTTAPNQMMARIHDRMPVILEPDAAAAWLRDGGADLLRAAPESTLAAVPVSTRVNSVKHDDPACLTPVDPGAPRAGQLRLF